MIIVISGPGGVGKGTVVARLIESDPALWLSTSWTTREPRPGESADAYTFVSRAEFEDHIAHDGFLEWAEFLDNLYGTPYPDPGSAVDVVLEIDVQGALRIRELYPDAVLVFIRPPSREVQRARMLDRGDDDADVVERRLANAAAEEAEAVRSFDHIIVNDEVDRAVGELAAILDRRRRAR